MKIILKKVFNRFAFDVLYKDRVIYSSSKDFFITPFIQPSYKYAWECCRDAWQLKKRDYHLMASVEDLEKPLATDISAENMISDHYVKVLKNLRIEVKSKDQEKKDLTYKKLKLVIDEIQKIIEKITEPNDKADLHKILLQYKKLMRQYFPQHKEETEVKQELPLDISQLSNTPPMVTASNKEESIDNYLDEETMENLFDDYAQKICKAIQNKHNDVYYTLNVPKKLIVIWDFNNIPILKVRINEQMNVDNITPVGDLYRRCPYHKVDFYQKYWKPIVESLGHFCSGNILILSENLPDVDKDSHVIEGWNCSKRQKEFIEISFRGEKPIWIISPKSEITKTAQISNQVSKYTEMDYLNAIVKCIDSNLKSIYQRTGSVIQVIPETDVVEIDVDFGSGLGIVRLTEKQVEIIKT